MNYTLLITSCDRHDLLGRTIASFLKYADIRPREIVISEDGPALRPDWTASFDVPVRWLPSKRRLGQIHSADRLWKECSTDWAFWCEDDWEFTESGFLQQSAVTMTGNPHILTCSLRSDWNHPLIQERGFTIAEPNWKGGWGGFTFNPGLRRRVDYDRIGGCYGDRVGYGTSGLGHEMALSQLYLRLGYRIAVPNAQGYCHHIGSGRSRAIEPLPQAPKTLIAIPACRTFEYSRWESDDSPRYHEAKNFNQKPYGTGIHISGQVNPRVEAVRDTWWKDISRYPSVTGKFFYGTPHPPNEGPKDDEVWTQVPDDYEHLPFKTIAICRYALANGYEYLYKCDDDTAVYVDRLVREICEETPDYAGYEHGSVCTGGPGYILSRRAMEVVATWTPDHWAEDVSTARALMQANIKSIMLPGHRPGHENHWVFPQGFDPRRLDSSIVTMHAVQPEVMRAWFQFKEQIQNQTISGDGNGNLPRNL